MKSLKNLSIDELLDRREELSDARIGGEDYHLNEIIRIEEILLRKFSQEEDNEYSVRKTKTRFGYASCKVWNTFENGI